MRDHYGRKSYKRWFDYSRVMRPYGSNTTVENMLRTSDFKHYQREMYDRHVAVSKMYGLTRQYQPFSQLPRERQWEYQGILKNFANATDDYIAAAANLAFFLTGDSKVGDNIEKAFMSGQRKSPKGDLANKYMFGITGIILWFKENGLEKAVSPMLPTPRYAKSIMRGYKMATREGFDKWIRAIANEIRRLSKSSIVREMSDWEIMDNFAPMNEEMQDEKGFWYYYKDSLEDDREAPKKIALRWFTNTVRSAKPSFLEGLGLEDLV